jgi:hypothetical protein
MGLPQLHLTKEKLSFFLYILYYNIYQFVLQCISHIFLIGTFLEWNVQSLMYHRNFYDTIQRFISCIQSWPLRAGSGPGEKCFPTPVKGVPDKNLPTKIEKTDSQLKSGWGLVWKGQYDNPQKMLLPRKGKNYHEFRQLCCLLLNTKHYPPLDTVSSVSDSPALCCENDWKVKLQFGLKRQPYFLFLCQRKFLLHIFIIN